MTHLDLAPDPSALGRARWNTFAAGDRLTAAQFLDGAAALLQATVAATDAPDPELLVQQLAATLSLDARETSLRIPDAATAPGTRQIADQAVEIGEGITRLAGDVLARVLRDPIPLPAGPVEIRSHCDNHLWTHPVTDLLQGQTGGPVPMQLYNEWLHQVVLLRDALLPFANWQEVPLPVDPSGLRAVESARDTFLTELLVRSTRHAAIVSFARSVLTGAQGRKAYGFDYPGGRVLPAVVGAGLDAPSRLLTWRPLPNGPAEPVDFVPATADYFDAPRASFEAAPDDQAPVGIHDVEAEAEVDAPAGAARTATIVIRRGDSEARVDLGDALRGHRFAYTQPPTGDEVATAAAQAGADGVPSGADDARRDETSVSVDPWSVLAASGLSWAEAGTWSVDATGADELTQLALLGALYPENVILTSARNPGDPITVGKTGPARVIVDR